MKTLSFLSESIETFFLGGGLSQFVENGAKILIEQNFRYVTQYQTDVVIGHIVNRYLLRVLQPDKST